MSISYCIPTKNNLRYLKGCIKSINDSTNSSIVVFIDSDTDGTEEWLKTTHRNIKYIKNTGNKPLGIAAGYNRCIELASTDVVCMFHADMHMATGFEQGILKYLTEGTIVSATRIEPPLHPEGKEKIVRDFGIYPENFKKAEFDSFIKNFKPPHLTTNGIFAPWVCYKKDITVIGMHDECLHSYHEDTDIFQRFLLNGYHTVQSWEAFVYHLTCRGGQFQDGVDAVTTDKNFHIMKQRSFRYFLRKWGGGIRNNEYLHPILPHKYNIGFVIEHATNQLVSLLEPLCSTIYVDCNCENYIQTEQVNSVHDISKRVRPLSAPKDNDIIVSFDGNKLTNQSTTFLFNILPDTIANTNSTGEFEYDIFKIDIKKLNCLNNSLIVNPPIDETKLTIL